MRALFAALVLFAIDPAFGQVGTVALTFDYHVSSLSDVWLEMSSRGFRGTYYVAPETINQSGGPTQDHLILVTQLGNEIGVYTNTDMVAMWTSNRVTAFNKLKSLYDGMEAFGFKVHTLAPNERKWNGSLANYSRARYDGVRAANLPSPANCLAIQSYPIPDPVNVVNGCAVASLGSGTSLQSVKDATDAAIAAGGMIIIVIHKIGASADALTFAYSDWISLLNYWQGKGGALRVLPFNEALKAP